MLISRLTRKPVGKQVAHPVPAASIKCGLSPIIPARSEHVAKTIAVARKNFLFAATPGGASASAMIYSLLETAKANG